MAEIDGSRYGFRSWNDDVADVDVDRRVGVGVWRRLCEICVGSGITDRVD